MKQLFYSLLLVSLIGCKIILPDPIKTKYCDNSNFISYTSDASNTKKYNFSLNNTKFLNSPVNWYNNIGLFLGSSTNGTFSYTFGTIGNFSVRASYKNLCGDDISINSNTFTIVNDLIFDAPLDLNGNFIIGGTNYNYNAASILGRKGTSNSALSFNGINQRLDYGNIGQLQEFSISIWINPGLTQQNEFAMILDYNHNNNRSWFFQQSAFQNNKYVFGAISTENGNSAQYYTDFLLLANQWTHLVLIKSNTSIFIYKNGNLFLSTSYLGKIPYDNSQKLTIGARDNSSNSRFWNGKLDDIKIYNRILTASEISILFNS